MGESNESVPLVLIRGTNVSFTDRKLSWQDFAINYQTDIYFRGMKNSDPFI